MRESAAAFYRSPEIIQTEILPHHPAAVRIGGELPPLGEAQTGG